MRRALHELKRSWALNERWLVGGCFIAVDTNSPIRLPVASPLQSGLRAAKLWPPQPPLPPIKASESASGNDPRIEHILHAADQLVAHG